MPFSVLILHKLVSKIAAVATRVARFGYLTRQDVSATLKTYLIHVYILYLAIYTKPWTKIPKFVQ